MGDAYDFSRIDLLIDVGGGHGRLMQSLLDRFPNLRGIVFDPPHVVSGAEQLIAERGLTKRCVAEPGHFFKNVPAGGDAYIMTAILHDWDDAACVAILRNCRTAMQPAGRVLIGEFVLKPANEPDFGKIVDLEMLVMSDGRERTAEEFRGLLAQADLRLNRIVPLSSGTSLIEALPA